MPFKFNAARCHRIPRARYRVRNWPQYEAGLKQRGDLTLWIDEAAIAGWQAPRRATPGGQARYSDLAIQLVLTLRLVFHLALRQAEAFAGSVFRLLGLDLFIPDHTTLSRRSRNFAGRRPHTVSHGPVHLLIDSHRIETVWSRLSGMRRSMAGHDGPGASCISLLTPIPANSLPVC